MIEVTIKNYLDGALNGVPVFLELPEVPSEDYPQWPERFVLIEKVGGSRRNFVQLESFAIQSHSTKRLADAAALDEQVRDAMDMMAEDVEEIGSCRMASNYNHTDIRTKRYRYQCVYDIAFSR